MSAIVGFVKHLITAMVKGFIFTGIIAAAISFAVLYVASPGHQLVMGLTVVYAIIIAVLAAFLGSAVALIYHLSHIKEIRHVVQHATSATRDREGQPLGSR